MKTKLDWYSIIIKSLKNDDSFSVMKIKDRPFQEFQTTIPLQKSINRDDKIQYKCKCGKVCVISCSTLQN